MGRASAISRSLKICIYICQEILVVVVPGNIFKKRINAKNFTNNTLPKLQSENCASSLKNHRRKKGGSTPG
jgi:hypothetical protein